MLDEAVLDAPLSLHIVDVEAAINHWRARPGAVDGITLGAELRALAGLYARMIFARTRLVPLEDVAPAAMQAWLAWYETTPDTPCIAICSTSQGDALCKGCGRTFAEVQGWTGMHPAQKRAVWRRITLEGSAWRFNRYAERTLAGAAPAGQSAPAPADP